MMIFTAITIQFDSDSHVSDTNARRSSSRLNAVYCMTASIFYITAHTVSSSKFPFNLESPSNN